MPRLLLEVSGLTEPYAFVNLDQTGVSMLQGPGLKKSFAIHPDPAQEAQEWLGRLSDRVSELRARDARGDDEAFMDLEALRDELASLSEDFADLPPENSNDSGPVAQTG